MNNQNLIIYKFNSLYRIFKEIEKDIGFEVVKIDNEESLIKKTDNLSDYLILSKKKILNIEYQFILNQLPVPIIKIIEKINIEILRNKFRDKSKINIKNYIINLNTREISLNKKKLKLTEKEVNTIVYLFKKKSSVSIDELQTNVWKYKSDIETHTVETHIYRLRDKFLNFFNDENFIISNKNGYLIH